MVHRRRYKVLAAIPKPDGSEWFMRVGKGFGNRDASINAYLDVIPVVAISGKPIKIQIRELDDAELRRIEGSSTTPAAPGGPHLPTTPLPSTSAPTRSRSSARLPEAIG